MHSPFNQSVRVTWKSWQVKNRAYHAFLIETTYCFLFFHMCVKFFISFLSDCFTERVAIFFQFVVKLIKWIVRYEMFSLLIRIFSFEEGQFNDARHSANWQVLNSLKLGDEFQL